MHLVQLLLPLYDNEGKPFPAGVFETLRVELTERFGGVTAYARSPARGFWKEDPVTTVRDDIVIYEVMAEDLDRAFWSDYREMVRRRLRQDTLIVRAHPIEML